MAKDFFDEEYEKQQQADAQKRQQQQASFESWNSAPVPPQKSTAKPLYIVLLCVALVACIGFGWLLGFIVQSVTSSPSDDYSAVLDEVRQYMERNYYQDITDEQWTAAIEASGTALMQTAGDRFCRLMSPQTYYNFSNPQLESGTGEVFGVSFIIEEGIGMYVSSVMADSSAYGRVFEGDIVLRLSNLRTKQGEAVVLDGVILDRFDVGSYDSLSVQNVLSLTYSANFHILRADSNQSSGYEIVTVNLTRSAIVKNSSYNFSFVEFYFGSDCTNVSTEQSKPAGAAVSTESLRHLDQLPADTGYVRLLEFSDYNDVNGNFVSSASLEFGEVMDLFNERGLKHLVLDLKGNPGGSVQYACEIAAMLVTDSHLTEEEKAKVVNDRDELLITTLEMPKPSTMTQRYYQPRNYMLGAVSDKPDIVVWTDGNSASASEMLTGCLLDYRTAVQMGTTSYGKGIAQTYIELPIEGRAVDLSGNVIQCPWVVYFTCAKYYSPFGVNIHGSGFTPASPYNGLSDYSQLWQAVGSFWSTAA